MKALVYPMFVMVVLSFAVAVWMFIARMQGLRSGVIRFRYFKTMSEGDATEAMKVTARHFTNLFEVPVLFYAACILGIVLQVQSTAFLWCAWFFVICRIVQAGIHLTVNAIRPRALVFFAGFVTVVTMWTLLISYAAFS